MKKIASFCLVIFLFSAIHISAFAQADKASEKFKSYINHIVQKVENTEKPAQKRTILNKSLDDLITAMEQVEAMKSISAQDKIGIAFLKSSMLEKKNELNGLDGFKAVKDKQLNNFANYIQQDIEQADTVTISVTVLLLIVIILLLL